MDCKSISMIKTVEEAEAKKKEGEFVDGEYFHEESTALNKKWQVCDKGITIYKDKTRWLAALICHAPDEKFRYARLNWFRKSFYEHGGFFKIENSLVMDNCIKTLEKIDANFDEQFNFTGQFGSDDDDDESLIVKFTRDCPTCGSRVKKSRRGRYYECERCGEIIILDDDNNPLFNIPADKLDLSFSTRYPINYYLPIAGITIKNLMAEWKAIVVIYDPDNPEKKFLRFYWWTRNLQEFMQGRGRVGGSSNLAWRARRGAKSTNVYQRELIPKYIQALKKVKKELEW